MSVHQSAPTPEVQYLPSLLRQIDTGKIRIPAFQRSFVWSEKQILELLESVFQGFPIGSLLFWRVENALMKVESSSDMPFPNLEVTYPLSFVLDGMQRLSSLYGVLRAADSTPGSFNVAFDLRERKFLKANSGESTDTQLPLNRLFDPIKLIEWQRKLTGFPDASELIEGTVELQSVFQEYLIPTVTIQDRPVEDVVRIFERINSTGTSLGSVDFVRALTWSGDFDLRTHVEDISILLNEFNFEVPEETLVKALGVAMEIPPAGDGLLQLQSRTVPELLAGIDKLKVGLRRTAEFFTNQFGYESFDFIPYEGQFLSTLAFFLESDQESEQLTSWNWSVAFTERLRGRPDHYVAKLITDIRRAARGQGPWPMAKDKIEAEAFRNRRFTRGRALSGALAGMFGQHAPRSIVSGHPIPRGLYLGQFSKENYGALARIPNNRDSMNPSEKLLANICLLTEDDNMIRRTMGNRSCFDIVRFRQPNTWREILASQLVPADAMSALESNDLETFLDLRAQYLAVLATQLSYPTISAQRTP